MLETKIAEIKRHFSELIGSHLAWYETAECQLDDGTWDPWPDLPIRMYADSGKMVAVSWSEFDSLWVRTDCSLPFDPKGMPVRWVKNSIEKVNAIVGGAIGSVMIGRGEMSIEGREIEIWTRLLVQVGERWLEVFNALDENGYDVHATMPKGDFVRCV